MTVSPLTRKTDRCVKCGLCLPHCPTYLKLVNEADSPRGRIALIQAYAGDTMQSSVALIRHLDLCLGCRACEQVCPSEVAYGEILDEARALIRQRRFIRPWMEQAWLLRLLSDRSKLESLSRLLGFMNKLGLGKIIQFLPRRLQLLFRLSRSLSAAASPVGNFPVTQSSMGTVQLFTGCIASKTEQQTINAAVKLLNHLNYSVEIPQKQVCCGALHRHNGDQVSAEHLIGINRGQFDGETKPLITLTSACHLELKEHLPDTYSVLSLTEFLLQPQVVSSLRLRPLGADVVVHSPCTTRNDRTLSLLRLIPDLKPRELTDNAICCGSAGSYLLRHPEMATSLGRDKITLIQQNPPDMLVTSNTGCAMQFRLLLEDSGLNIEIKHPIELIWQQLDTKQRSIDL